MATNPFSLIPTRPNSGAVDASWWNTIKAAGLQLDAYVTGLLGAVQTVFVMSNNISTWTAITGLAFDSTVTSAIIEYEIHILSTGTGATELKEVGRLTALFRYASSSWVLIQNLSAGDDSGVTFNITAAGQVQYQTPNISGTISKFNIKYKLTTFGVAT